MTLISPNFKPADRKPATNPSSTRAILGAEDSLEIRRIGRPIGVADVVPFFPQAFAGGASSGEVFCRTLEE